MNPNVRKVLYVLVGNSSILNFSKCTCSRNSFKPPVQNAIGGVFGAMLG